MPILLDYCFACIAQMRYLGLVVAATKWYKQRSSNSLYRTHYMHIHILGICGTFMGSLAILAKELGFEVSGSDTNVYPPMSTQLEAAGIELIQGYDPEQLDRGADLIVVGNAMSRGNPAVEYMLNRGLPYVSGPQWLAEYVLKGRWVLAAAGTHGKTTTSSMLAWILEYAGLTPGFLIGGIPGNFGISARLGNEPFFVIEADEYDTAFFDKRSKFVHYQPRTAILNNLEFDHADIFEDMAAIRKQFHHLVRMLPGEGLIVAPQADDNIRQVLAQGCWTPTEFYGEPEAGDAANWHVVSLKPDGSEFEIMLNGVSQGIVAWNHTGRHNLNNAVAAIAAARHAGVMPEHAIAALCEFKGVKRRMELLGEVGGVTVYDDFAHHPTAIASTLEGLRNQVGTARIFAVIEPVSNTMRMGIHQAKLGQSSAAADQVLWYQAREVDWDFQQVIDACPGAAQRYSDIDQLINDLCQQTGPGDQVVIMSNGGFGGIHQKLLQALREHHAG